MDVLVSMIDHHLSLTGAIIDAQEALRIGLVDEVLPAAELMQRAEAAAFAIAGSPLVKTAIFGRDANWGRVAMAIGKSGCALDPEAFDITFAGVPDSKLFDRVVELPRPAGDDGRVPALQADQYPGGRVIEEQSVAVVEIERAGLQVELEPGPAALDSHLTQVLVQAPPPR